MTDQEFLQHVFRYAEALKQSPLTWAEKDQITSTFNSVRGDAYERARQAVRHVLRVADLGEELRKSANVSNTGRLLQDLQAAASQWQSSKQ